MNKRFIRSFITVLLALSTVIGILTVSAVAVKTSATPMAVPAYPPLTAQELKDSYSTKYGHVVFSFKNRAGTVVTRESDVVYLKFLYLRPRPLCMTF